MLFITTYFVLSTSVGIMEISQDERLELLSTISVEGKDLS